MADTTDNSTSILKNDPDFAGLDFNALRAEGIGYIAELSGKIWTDHNVHDPGITILELLCYALIDLGYRTRMPAVDLFSRNPADAAAKDDNFFTPAEILTCNPVTIMDFRKLLIDIPGVKNAWLEVSEEPVDCQQEIPHPNVEFILTHPQPPECRSFLNGLYKVFIELYKGPYTPEAQWSMSETERIHGIVDTIREVLMAHRNLCEDFVSIKILCKEKIGVCADIDLDPDADAEKIYVKIIETLRVFFSPDPKFYTLPQLLDKGKPIDEIFAGRPYLTESHGFVDTAELEAIPFRKEIHVSDVYNALFGIQGIRTIRRLRLRTCGGDDRLPDNCEQEWKYFLAENHTPEFSIDCSGFRFTRTGRPVTVNEKKYKDLFALNYSYAGKIFHDKQLPALDLPIPQGIYRPDLTDYYSIQAEMPRVYGVSEGGISANASPLRQAQALQLKGYLLFFDQLLANYLVQLGDIRKLFAMKNSKGGQTYFSGMPLQVSDADRLLNLHPDEGGSALVQALPVEKKKIDDLVAQNKINDVDLSEDFEHIGFVTASDRDAAIYLLMDDLQNKNYSIHTVQNKCDCWFFYLYTSSNGMALISRTDYPTAQAAQTAATNLAYVGGFAENYKSYTTANNSTSYFSLELGMEGYGTYLQKMVEDKPLYEERRKAFLDHLLARFAESFTDFALLSFDSLNEGQVRKQDLDRKSKFLSGYDQLGRDRGRAYDYRTNRWNLGNVSGFEDRVKAFAGMGDCCGETLCHFEVFEYTGQFYWTITAAGKELFKSTALFDTPAESVADLELFMKAMKEDASYKTVPVPLHDTHALAIEYKGDQILYPRFQQQPEEAMAIGAHLRQLLKAEPQEGDISVSSQIFRPQLLDDNGTLLRSTKQSFENGHKAQSAARSLIKKINDEEWETAGEAAPARLELKAAKSDPFRLIDIAHFTKNVTVCPDEYRWELNDTSGKPVLKSDHSYASRQLALESLLNELTAFEPSDENFKTYEEGGQFYFRLYDTGSQLLAHSLPFNSEEERSAAISFIKDFCLRERNDKQYTYRISEAAHWQVDFGEGLVFQSTALLADSENAMNTWRKEKRAFRVKENYVWDWDADGHQQLSVRSDSQETIARLVPGERTSLDEEIFDKIQASLNARTFQATALKVAQGFGFRLHDANGQVLLSGYLVYKSRGEAFFTLLRALDKAGQESMYLRSGDEGNREFTFFLKTDERQFLAEHPVLYDTDTEREEALHRTIQLAKDRHSIADGPKDPVRHTYSISTADRMILSSAQKFTNIREAGEAANNLLLLAAEPSNYQFYAVDSGSYDLRLVQGDQWLATVPGSFADPVVAEGARNEVVQTIRRHLYQVKVAAFDDRWRFTLPLGMGNERVLFQSAGEYESPEAAKEAYKKMAADLPNLKIQRTEGKTELVSKQKGTKSWVSATLVPLSEGMPESATDAALAASQTLYQLAGGDDVKLLQKTVKKDDLAEQGTWVYRLVKKDDYFAYHLDCKGEEGGDAGIKNLHALASGKPDYLLICLGGDIVYPRTDASGNVRYHFMIKARNVYYPGSNKELVLFISTKAYNSPEEAEQAFNDEYLLILKRASQTRYYGEGKVITFSETATKAPGDCAQQSATLACVPAETRALFADEATAIAQLSALARSYPVRLSGRKRYKFSLYDYKKEASYFISAASYNTPVEAMQAFLFLLVLVRNRRNYYSWCDPDTGQQLIVIREVLLESSRRYPSSDAAWGYEGVEKLIGIVQTEGSFHISVNRDDCCFSFFVACKSKITHPCTYDTVLSRDRALRRLYQAFSSYQLPELPVVGLSADARYYEVRYGGRLLLQLPLRNDTGKGGLCTDAFLDFIPWILTQKCPDVQGKDGFVLTSSEGVEMARLDNPTMTAKEWIEALVKMATLFPVYKKDGSFYFRLPYPDPLGVVDSSMSDPCGCDEQLPPDGDDCYTAWIGGCYNSCDEALRALSELPEKFKDETRYRPVFDCSCGAYRIEFIDSKDIVAFNPQCYSTREMVCAAVERAKTLINCEGIHLVEHILLRPRCPEHCGCLIPAAPDNDCQFKWVVTNDDPCRPAASDPCFTPGADPYSCIATIVLPAWSRRFRTAANRELVEHILYREAPSHIMLRILWLSPKDCYNFEQDFRGWLRWLADKRDYCGAGFNLCSFIGLLFRNPLDCWWPGVYCAPCQGETAPLNPCAELNDQKEKAGNCNLSINDVFNWTTPDCCYEYPRVELAEEDEKMKAIRRRASRYMESLNALQARLPEDAAIGSALSYIKGNKPDEERLLRIVKSLKDSEASGDLQDAYREAEATVISFYLDRSLLDQYDSKTLSNIKRTVRKLELDKGVAPLVLNGWSAAEVSPFVHTKTISALEGIFKK